MNNNFYLNLTKKIDEAEVVLEKIIKKTPLQLIERLSNFYQAKIYFKREDLQKVRSFKIRGAYYKLSQLTKEERKKGVVTASAGNHAQGVALSCRMLKIKGTIFMPVVTPRQKIDRVIYFGNSWIEVKLKGDNYDQASSKAKKFSRKTGAVYIHAFDDIDVIAGQGTVAKEIINQMNNQVDYVIIPIGGGGLISGVASYFKEKSPQTKIIGVESIGTQSMFQSLKKKRINVLEKIDTFCDGIAVKEPGKIAFSICQDKVDEIITVPEGKVAQSMIDLFQNEGIITEPAGAITVAALDHLKEEIKGKTVICLISGGNFDLLRYPEVLERSLIYQEKKHYFIVEFTQKPGQLKRFVNEVLGQNDDIVLFDYLKKNNKEKGPVLIGMEYLKREDYLAMKKRMEKLNFNFKEINPQDSIFHLLVY